MFQSLSKYFPMGIISIFLVALLGCQASSAPLEFAPDGAVIQQTIKAKLATHYRDLSQTITATPPQLEIKNITVKDIDSLFLNRLPVYHVRGTYDVSLTFSRQDRNRRNNSFDLYLQRQQEGKTWRSLQPDARGWRSYQLE
ncbi:MAG: hypothetical protein HC799_14005 [Limnothrix sp. RL_2_0]|nr:hypothetical protein [Limnothrix sp. RL_2_0]